MFHLYLMSSLVEWVVVVYTLASTSCCLYIIYGGIVVVYSDAMFCGFEYIQLDEFHENRGRTGLQLYSRLIPAIHEAFWTMLQQLSP